MTQINSQVILNATRISNMFDLLNAIRNSSSEYFQQFVPLANAENVAEVGSPIINNTQIRNEFIEALVNRIGVVVIRHVTLSNPLARFKTGRMDMGDTLEEIFTDLASSQKYDVNKSESELFKREIPNVHALYHKLNRRDLYKQTVQEQSLKQAFISWDKFGSFVSSVIQAIYNKAEVDEYYYMKELLTLAYSKGHFKMVALNQGMATVTPANYVEQARKYAMDLTLPMGSRKYNSFGVHTRTNTEDLVILMTSDLAAKIDVNVLASAFNMDKASFIGQRIILDSLFENPRTGEKVEMMLIDKNFFMVLDNLLEMRTIYNPQGLYWNYMLHVWQVMSYSRFANAVAFVSNLDTAISEIVLAPQIYEMQKSAEHTFNLNVRYVDNSPLVPEFTIEYKALVGGIPTPEVTITPNATNKQRITVATSANATDFTLQAILTVTNPPNPDVPQIYTSESIVTVV